MKIISGGQTGVDRAALDAALEIGVEIGGWCPKGRLAEDGVIPDKYPLKEMPSPSYKQRTLKNVIHSDGTAIIYFAKPSGGTEQTIAFCIKEKKPYLLIDADEIPIAKAAGKIEQFMNQNSISILNVAGPRASSESKGYDYTKQLIMRVFHKD